MLTLTSCNNLFESMEVKNENAPNINEVDFYALIKNGYNTWYNGSIAASPTLGFASAELIQAGTNSWGSGTMWFRPRQALFNGDAPDPVIIINFGAWYNYYTGIGMAIKCSKSFNDPSFKVIVGGVDYTTRAKAHSYIVQALLYGNIALLYDKAYLYTEESDFATFDFAANTKSYKEVMNYAIIKLDQAIALLEADNTDTDPVSVVAGSTFDKATLLQFANSMGARFLACNARTQAENATTDWNKVKTYAQAGLQQNFQVSYEPGWQGKVMTRDEGANYFALSQWSGGYWRVSNWLIHKMAPDDPASVYPIPVTAGSDSYLDWPAVTNCPDARLNTYFHYDPLRNWFGATRTTRAGYGTYILGTYRYWRYYDVVYTGMGIVDHFLKAENDTYLAEALIRINGDKSLIATLINNSRVGVGALTPATDGESYDDLENKLFYERYVECDMVWPQLGFFDRRRNKDQMIPGTARHFPIPAPELTQHGQDIYTFGGNQPEM